VVYDRIRIANIIGRIADIIGTSLLDNPVTRRQQTASTVCPGPGTGLVREGSMYGPVDPDDTPNGTGKVRLLRRFA
jgi:hypothetical protein